MLSVSKRRGVSDFNVKKVVRVSNECLIYKHDRHAICILYKRKDSLDRVCGGCRRRSYYKSLSRGKKRVSWCCLRKGLFFLYLKRKFPRFTDSSFPVWFFPDLCFVVGEEVQHDYNFPHFGARLFPWRSSLEHSCRHLWFRQDHWKNEKESHSKSGWL